MCIRDRFVHLLYLVEFESQPLRLHVGKTRQVVRIRRGLEVETPRVSSDDAMLTGGLGDLSLIHI